MTDQVVDVSRIFVIYNFIVGVLLVTSSSTLSTYVDKVGSALGFKADRYVSTGLKALGGSWAVLSAGIFIAFHLLRLGLD